MPAFFTALNKIKPLYDWTYKIIMFICKVLLSADIIITSWVVCGRYFPFITTPYWGEEIILTLMVYMAVLSATLAIRTGAHIRMTALDRYIPEKALAVLDVLADLAVMAFGIIMLIVGTKYATTLGSRGFYVSLPKLSKFWQYLPIPLAGFAMIVFEIEILVKDLKKFFVKEEV